MASDLKRHNPLSIGLAKIPPDWISPEGFKWWGIDAGDPQDGHAALIEKPSGEMSYVILDQKGVFYETESLEFLFGEFDHLRIIREHS